MSRFVVLAMVVALPALADEKKPAAESSLKGKWEVTAARFNGSEMATLKGRSLVFDETEFSTYDGETKGRGEKGGTRQVRLAKHQGASCVGATRPTARVGRRRSSVLHTVLGKRKAPRSVDRRYRAAVLRVGLFA